MLKNINLKQLKLYSMKNGLKIAEMIMRALAIGIFAYSAYMKITGAPAAVYIFQRIGLEPVGRYLVSVIEIIAIILLILPKTVWKGAIMGMFMMFGAICMHLTMAEINILGDGGLMFAGALVVFISCIGILSFHRRDMDAELS